MRRLGTKIIRLMSYPPLEEGDPDGQMEEERFRRLRVVCAIFLEAGMLPLHENCMNYGGMSWRHTLRLLENVPGLKLVFDTGNPVFSDDLSKPRPYPKQSVWGFYTHVREHIAYVHIKDGIWDAGAGKMIYTYPGEGQGDVIRVVRDLLKRGYDGGFSIEPHMAAVAHEASNDTTDEIMYRTYVEYGRRMEKILAEVMR
jgi:sugar phosphate isomerase/epimerase